MDMVDRNATVAAATATAAAASTAEANCKVCFVIPTYNEAGNIQPLLARLMELDAAWQVLIVDDASPDGTAELVQCFRADPAHAADAARIHLSTGVKRGLGAAYKRGMAFAMHQLHADIVVQMDADFSHDPSVAARLIERVRGGGVEVAIGSRYLDAATIDAEWHIFRRWLSNGGNWLARHIAGIRGVCDCTSGFRALRCAALQRVAVQQLPVNGYAFQIALLHRLIHHDARVVEYPIHFKQRAHGETKLGALDLLEFFISVWMLRFPSARTFTKFALTGLSGMVVNLSAFHLFMELGWHKYIASPLAVELSILWNFLLNNYWTFSHRELIGNKLVRGLRFNAVSLGTLLISFAAFLVLSAVFPNGLPLLHQAFAIVPAALFNYFINSYWTFKGRVRQAAERDSQAHAEK